MPKIPTAIEAKHVQLAIDAGLAHDFGESRDYDLVHNNKRYPPKAMIGIAAEYATGQRLHHSDFSSGVASGQACRVLYDLGFQIVEKYSDHDVFAKRLFRPGQAYRRTDLHDQYGGQRQGGISTPKKHPLIFLITGESGSQYGYADGFRDDGTFWYTGEGQVGDMEMVRGNGAILNHKEDGKVLYVFRDLGDGSLQHLAEAE